MKIDIEIANTTRKIIDAGLVKKIAARVIKGEMGEADGFDIEVSAAFVSPQKIKALNKKWREIDRVTDVLSFGQDDFLSRFSKGTFAEHEFLGELVICADQVAKDAKDLKKTLNQELSWVIAHGMLHLFGYDHEREKDAVLMRQKEESYLKKSSE